jgi:signal transduction histidine kinase
VTTRRTGADFSGALTAINLHRIWWTIIVAGALNVAILAFNLLGSVLHSPQLAAWQGVDVLASIVLLLVIRWLEKQPGKRAWRSAAVVAYLLIVLALMDNYYFILLHVYGHMAAYVLGVITVGVLLLLPPPLFIGILLANHAIFCALLLASGQPASVVAAGILDGSCGVLVACLAEWFLYRAKCSDLDQQRIIAERNRELQLRNEEMGDVMAITAHDLRSPLQGVKHLLDFAAPMGGPERLAAALRMASQSCADMIALIGRLLDAHAAGGDSAVSDGDLRGQFESAASRAQPLAVAKGIRVDLMLPDRPAHASFEAGALSQVLDNLLDNAIKFSPPGAVVTLELIGADGEWCAEVRDEGTGIAESERESIFHKFHRGGAGDEPGSGLGLFIVRKSMETMGGSVNCEPREGGGTIFRLCFAPAGGAV